MLHKSIVLHHFKRPTLPKARTLSGPGIFRADGSTGFPSLDRKLGQLEASEDE